jgi:putative transposase
MPPAEVSIDPVPTDADQATIEKGVNFPTLQRVIGKTTELDRLFETGR